MWRKVLSWEVNTIAPKAEWQKYFNFLDYLWQHRDRAAGALDLTFPELGKKPKLLTAIYKAWQNAKGPEREIVVSSLQKTSVQLTAETITNKQIEPGDYVIPNQTFKDNTDRIIFTQGKEYPVLDYFLINQIIGVKVHSDMGPWTITFRDDGIGKHFSWRKPSNEEKAQTTLENNPFITDILNIVTTSGSYPMTVEQITDKVLQLYISEGGKMHPKEFQAKMSTAWGDAFHLGLVAMVRRSDKVSITPEGRQYLQG
jgi:hypothetical protein